MNLNWMILLIPLMMLPMTYKIYPSRMKMLFINIFSNLNKEIEPHLSSNMMHMKSFLQMIFYFICASNLFSLLPYTYASTSMPMINISMAFTLWLTIMIYAWINFYDLMYEHLVPMGTPLALTPFSVFIELISLLIRPLTLSIRLTANMIAGHLLITLMSSLSLYLDTMNQAWTLINFQTILLILEVAVAVIQGYIFMLLFTIYSSEI